MDAVQNMFCLCCFAGIYMDALADNDLTVVTWTGIKVTHALSKFDLCCIYHDQLLTLSLCASFAMQELLSCELS